MFCFKMQMRIIIDHMILSLSAVSITCQGHVCHVLCEGVALTANQQMSHDQANYIKYLSVDLCLNSEAIYVYSFSGLKRHY